MTSHQRLFSLVMEPLTALRAIPSPEKFLQEVGSAVPFARLYNLLELLMNCEPQRRTGLMLAVSLR